MGSKVTEIGPEAPDDVLLNDEGLGLLLEELELLDELEEELLLLLLDELDDERLLELDEELLFELELEDELLELLLELELDDELLELLDDDELLLLAACDCAIIVDKDTDRGLNCMAPGRLDASSNFPTNPPDFDPS